MKQIHVVGAVIERDGLILCAHRGTASSLPGLWEFPGGKIEQSETPREALERKITGNRMLEAEVEVEGAEDSAQAAGLGIWGSC